MKEFIFLITVFFSNGAVLDTSIRATDASYTKLIRKKEACDLRAYELQQDMNAAIPGPFNNITHITILCKPK